MKKVMLAGLLAAAAVFSTGCSNACDSFQSTLKDRYKECSISAPDSDEDGEKLECTQNLADQSEKSETCLKKASCDQVRANTWDNC
ncbi:hypothetical protein [Hyalangium rubrum]|uniref:Lipoprotein n=1 Tax=Hyalangium rubrum TaxID=3103134 RepID=A0ABU5HEC9_9BACT|nr:hypothetical protein [Hyalangium sp. s54d21]MDY7231474.1 hypothetical protein [Hyalangium sp. s54d21]